MTREQIKARTDDEIRKFLNDNLADALAKIEDREDIFAIVKQLFDERNEARRERDEARKEAEKYRDLLYPASEMSEDGIEYPTHYVVRLPWERPNPETPRGE